MDLSICIVNYKTRDLTLKAIDSIYTFFKSDLTFEIILIDNTPGGNISFDDVKKYKELKLFPSFTNSYFSGGYNAAVKQASGKYILLMCSDIIMLDDAITPLYTFLQNHSDYGAIEATLINQRNGEITMTGSKELTPFRDFVRSKNILKKIFSKTHQDYSYAGWDRLSDREVEVITNAFTMMKRELFHKIGGLEEAMKLYFTEERMSDKIRALGLKLYHSGTVRVDHYESASTGSAPSPWIKALYKSDRRLYFLSKSLLTSKK